MLGIYYAAIITTLVAITVFGSFIRKLPLPANERLLWLAMVIALPLQPLVFYWVRVPLDQWLAAQFGPASSAYQWLRSLYAPFTEEPAKLIPLLLPAIRHDIRPANFARYALAIGLGFAVGEMWFVAERVARNPALADLPFYQFGGYFSERLMTCVFHSAFLAVALQQLGRRFLLGLVGAMALHWLGNFPIQLMAWNVAGLGKTAWTVIVQCWLYGYFFASIALLAYFATGRLAVGALFFSRRHCPECEQDYDAPLLAVNVGSRRYERCPHCRHWHWTQPAKPGLPGN
jgi:hypothetical protein